MGSIRYDDTLPSENSAHDFEEIYSLRPPKLVDLATGFPYQYIRHEVRYG
jgi:hypothetical protein